MTKGHRKVALLFGASGMLILKKDTVSNWLLDGEEFSRDFMRYSFSWFQLIGLDVPLHEGPIKQAHALWAKTDAEWKAEKFVSGADRLSFTKTFSILLHSLSLPENEFCGVIKEFRPFQHPAPVCPFSDELKEKLRQDLAGAPDVVAAFEFCVCIMNHYERIRTDRKTPFVFRMTETSRHDLIASIVQRKLSPEAIFLAFENLYARH